MSLLSRIAKISKKKSGVSDRLMQTLLGVNHVVGELRSTQLSTNHERVAALEEIDKKVKNSGSIILSKEEMITKIFNGLKMYLDPRDIAVVPHLALDSIWEHDITAAWLSVVKPNDTVLDIGANFGYFGLIAAKDSDKKLSKVILFEANPNLIPYINKSLAVNWLNEQCVVENVAVSDKNGKLTLHVLKDYLGSSSVHDMEHIDAYLHEKMSIEEETAIEVSATSIDEYCRVHKIKNVNLIKMDIEGFEDVAYKGMRKTIQASEDVTLFVEFTAQSYADPEAFYDDMLSDFGNVYRINQDGSLLLQRKHSYRQVVGDPDDWVMLVFSKDNNLSQRGLV